MLPLVIIMVHILGFFFTSNFSSKFAKVTLYTNTEALSQGLVFIFCSLTKLENVSIRGCCRLDLSTASSQIGIDGTWHSIRTLHLSKVHLDEESLDMLLKLVPNVVTCEMDNFSPLNKFQLRPDQLPNIKSLKVLYYFINLTHMSL